MIGLDEAFSNRKKKCTMEVKKKGERDRIMFRIIKAGLAQNRTLYPAPIRTDTVRTV